METVLSSNTEIHVKIAEALYAAKKERRQIAPVIGRYPGLTVEDAYAVQRMGIRRAELEGARVTGKKIGLTAAELQASMHVLEPDYGYLLDRAAVPAGGAILISELFQPKVEAEIAFVLGRDVAENADAGEILDAAEYICPAFEIVDTRIADWKNTIVDTVSDNASAGLYLLGRHRVNPRGLDLSKLGATLYKNGRILGSGIGSVVMGNPLNSVAWLSRKLREHGRYLRKGEVILSGALCGAHPAQKGDLFEAEFSDFGPLSLRFV